MDPIVGKGKNKQWKSMGTINRSEKYLPQQKTEIHTGLKQLEGE